jgi:hypothetical protein
VSSGGLATGFISDRLQADMGDHALPMALSLTGGLFFLAAVFMFAAARAYRTASIPSVMQA